MGGDGKGKKKGGGKGKGGKGKGGKGGKEGGDEKANNNDPSVLEGFDSDLEDDGEKDALGRKVWDKEYFEAKAKSNIMFGPEPSKKRKHQDEVPLPASQRSYLKRDDGRDCLKLESEIGKMKVVTNHTIKPLQGGYWCSVCECLIKDSQAYLDHINGRRHNRNLGMNMKVENIGIDRVKDKLKSMKKKDDPAQIVDPEDVAARIKQLEEEEAEKKRRKKEKKKRKKAAAAGVADAGEESEESEDGPLAQKLEAAAAAGEKSGLGTPPEGEDASEGEVEESEETKMLRMMGLPTGFT